MIITKSFSDGSDDGKQNIDPFGTTIRYVGEDPKYRNTKSNTAAIEEHNKRVADLRGDTTSVYLDRATGKITVEAPDYVLEREGFKNQLESTLKTLSRYYKMDKNYKIPMQDGTSKSVEEIISDLNDPNNKESIVAYAESVRDMRDQEYGYDRGENKRYSGDRRVYKIDDSVKLNDTDYA